MSSTLSRSFDGFSTLFGEAAPEPETFSASASASAPPPPLPRHRRAFVFRARALDDALRLELVASDFASTVLRRVFTVDELEDTRDDVGIGGTWAEFIDYVAKSLGSEGVKLVIQEGASTAKLIAHKSKGMPRITLVLNRVMDSSTKDVVADMSLSLYTSLKDRDKDATEAHAYCQHLSGLLSSEKEKTENLQKQLDSLTFKSKRKAPMMAKGPWRQAPEASAVDTQIERVQPSEPPNSVPSQPTKAGQKAVLIRRSRPRGARLQDSTDYV